MMTDVAIDPAGNVWAANNWNNVERGDGRRESGPSHLDLGRRVGPHRHLRSRGPGEDPDAGLGAQAVKFRALWVAVST